MNARTQTLYAPSGRRPELGGSRLDGWARRAVHGQLGRLRAGAVRVTDRWGETLLGERGAPALHLEVHDPRFYRAAALRGSLGVAESYMDGEWSADDLVGLIALFVRNIDVVDGMEGGWSAAANALAWLGDRARRNTRRGSRRNIRAHYDLGNDLFELFLDETLTYSAGIFESDDATMADASRAKLDRICRKLALSPGDRVIEIGSGWGSFALHAATRYGCHVTTTTVSREQHARVSALVHDHALEDRVRVLLNDYRDLHGSYDKLVSIEMVEAVGHENLPRYFSVCSDLLHERGEALVQAITMPDRRYAQYRRGSDFIRRYVFPGSCVPSLGALLAAAAEGSDLQPAHLEDIGPHYARTLRRWSEAFEARLEDVRGLGFDERFVRLWRFYLAYCEAGFAERYLGDVQLLLRKPGCRAPSLLGRLD